MKSKLLTYPVIILLVCLMAVHPGLTQSAPVVLYHGYVTNTRNEPVSGSFELKFTLFDSATGGGPLWTETVSASISNGLFTAPLDFPIAVFNGLPRWLEIALRSNTSDPFMTLNPRQQLGAIPQSYYSLNAGQLSGMSSSNFANSAHTHSAQDIVSGVLAPGYGGTGIDTSGSLPGSVLYKASTSAWAALAPGTNGQVLKLIGGVPSWGTDNTGAGGGGGTVTSLTQGTGIVLSPNPITSTGTVSVDRSKIPVLDESNTWARVQTFGAGLRFPNGATFSLPEVDDEVLLMFEHGDVERPVVVGNLYSSKTPPARHGPSRQLQAGDAAGANGDGGNIVLQPGQSTGSGAGGQLIVQGNTNQSGGRFALTFDPSPVSGGSVFKISDSQNPIPQDRVIFNFDYLGTPSWRQPAQGDISGNAATASNAGRLDGFSWHNHPLLRDLNLNGWLANQVVTGAFPGIRLRGTLTDLSGEPRNGLVGVTARIYSTPTGGAPLYTEQFTQSISSGVLDVVLGIGSGTTTDDLVSALAPAAGAPIERYLTLQVEPDTEELSPRRRLTAGAYALYAGNAAQLGGQPASSYARLDQPSVFSTAPTFASSAGAPFSVGNNPNLVPNLNCDQLDGISSESFARLDTLNTFTQSQTFDGGVRLKNYSLISFEDPFGTPPEQIIIYPSLASQPPADRLAIAVDTQRSEVSLKGDSVAPEHPGTAVRIAAGNGAGTDKNGGDITLLPGVATGTGQPGRVKVAGELALADDTFNQMFASLTLKGKLKTEVGSLALTHAGTPMEFQAGAGAGALQPGGDVTIIAGDGGTDGNGGNIVLQPGAATGSGQPGSVKVAGRQFKIEDVGSGTIDTLVFLTQTAVPDGVLRYSAINNRWEISSSGGPFLAIATQSPGGGVDANTLDGLDSLQFLRSDTDSTTAGSLSVSGTGRKLVSRATLADETAGNVNKIEVQSSGGAPRFAVTEKGSVTASGTLDTRGFVVQFNESNQSFVTRLMEEEGIYYYFTHEGGTHRLVFGADNSAPEHSGQSFELKAGDGAGTDKNGGDITLRPGAPTGTGAPGNVNVAGTLQLGGNNLTGVGNNLTASGALTVNASGTGNSLTLQTDTGAGIENVNVTADDNVQITAVNGAITVNKPITGVAAKAGAAIANTTTPDVANLTALVLENYIAPAILTALQNGVNGQTVVLVGGNNAQAPRVLDTGLFKLSSDWLALPDHTLTLVFVNGSWLETSRSAN